MPEPEPPALERLSQAELVRLVLNQERRLAALEAENGRLRAENEALKRRSKRSAAPFSRDTLAAEPKPPGRRPGQGDFRFRPSPRPEELSELPIAVPVLEPCCPGCGGVLEEHRVDLASLTDLPEVARPVVRQYRVSVCLCTSCGRSIRGSHPDLSADQRGASANRLGPRAMAAAHALHYGLGVPQRKVPAVLKELTGLELTQGALAQDARRRLEGGVGTRYQELRDGIKDSTLVHTDDTGWRVGGRSAHLMVFKTEASVVYQIRDHHRNDEVRELVPSDYAGVMVCDRFFSYDAAALSAVRQQKCLSHVLRSISLVLDSLQGKRGGALASVFGQGLKETLGEGLGLWRERCEGRLEEVAYKLEAGAVLGRLDHLLRDRTLRVKANQRLLCELGRHHDQGNLARFLTDPRVSPTNNAAERALRPAVIARKVSQCSKNDSGARRFEAFKSVMETLRLEGKPVTGGLLELFSHTGPAQKPESG